MKIICGPENVKSFNQQLKAAVPDFHALAKVLYTEGMIDGLRGATLEFNPVLSPVVESAQPQATKHCEDCGQWRRDTVGFGQGLGTCLINYRPKLMKWPKQTACEKFKGNA